MSNPTTAEERERWWRKLESDPDAWMDRERALRLIADVERLEKTSPAQDPNAMPEPVEVWLKLCGEAGYQCYINPPEESHNLSGVIHPVTVHKIIPGMMNLQELWEAHRIRIIPVSSDSDTWRVCKHAIFNRDEYTFLEAQWAATQLAK